MRKTFFLLAVMPLVASAQSWCPPGATWTYGTDMFGLFGYAQYMYVGDTVVGGQQAQRIDAHGAMSIFGQVPVDIWNQQNAAITAQIDDVIAIWFPDAQAWDTLFWLGAVPGDRWPRADGAFGACDPTDSLVVVDTATVVLDGLPLRRWTIEQRSDGMTTYIETFTERLGWTMALNPYPACMVVCGPVGMRCYGDQDINVNFTSLGCESLAGIEDADSLTTALFPNPGTDRFTINLPPGAWTIDVLDALGRRMLTTRSNSERLDVDATALALGTYLVRISGATGNSITRLWTKQ